MNTQKTINTKIPPLIGESKFIRNIRSIVESVSKNTACVLLNGEKGTGKRLIAQHFHFAVSQNKKDFYEINPRKYSHDDIKMTLENIYNISSVFERKTLYISNVELLLKESQIFLLDFIYSVRKNNKAIKLICSTETDLELLSNNNLFNSDLFYIMSSLNLNIIPLRQRVEDIEAIVNYYLGTFNVQSGLKFSGFTEYALNDLCAQFWVGNIDELINCVQRAFIVGNNSYISSKDLGLSCVNESKSAVSTIESNCKDNKSLKNAVDSFKREYVSKILEENKWNQTKTAEILGIQRTYVIKLIKDLNIKK